MYMGLVVKRLVLVLLLLCSVTLLAGESLDAATKRLSTVDVFAFGGVGYAGSTSKGEIDFKIVLSQSPVDALDTYEKLYAIGNAQGKAYALSGMKKLNPARFKELLTSSGSATDQVKVMRGCIVSRESLRDVARQIDHHKFQF